MEPLSVLDLPRAPVVTYRYRMFGLEVASELPMCQEESGSGDPQVLIRLGTIPPQAGDVSSDRPLIASGPGMARFSWPRIGRLEVREGREILVDPVPDAGPELLAHIVQGVAMGALLDQRGVFTLHASAVAIEGRVLAFLGWKGQGKSTLCASLVGRGHEFVTDDILALPGALTPPVQVLPGTAQMKLYPDSVEASFGESAEALPQIWDLSPKRLRPVAHVADVVRPLAAIYVLDFHDRTEAAIEPVGAQAACVELIRHSYALRFLLQSGATPEHLARSARLVKSVPVRRLFRPQGMTRIPETIDALERDLRGLHPEAIRESRPAAAVPSTAHPVPDDHES